MRRCLHLEPVANKYRINRSRLRPLSQVGLNWKNCFLSHHQRQGFWMSWYASDILLEENEIMTSYMESLSPVPMSEIINMAVRQQMYAMKLSRDYLAA